MTHICLHCPDTGCPDPHECARLIPRLQNLERDHCPGPVFPDEKQWPDFHDSEL